jgi:hypothetical protein
MLDLILKRFDAPDETRVFPKGRFEVIRIGHIVIGRATYEPGWRWSVHIGAAAGKQLCEVPHLGIVLAGRAAVAAADGPMREIKAGDVFSIDSPHDSWVIGDEDYVSIHFDGADEYASRK